MNGITITFDHAVRMLVNIVERFGFGHVAGGDDTSGCRYIDFQNGNLRLVPVCIVGQVFSDLGILRALARDGEGDDGEQYGACIYGEALWDRAETMGVTFDKEAQDFLYAVQQRQDAPEPWGVALRRVMEERHDNLVDEAQRAVRNAEHAREQALADLPSEPKPQQFWDADETAAGHPF